MYFTVSISSINLSAVFGLCNKSHILTDACHCKIYCIYIWIVSNIFMLLQESYPDRQKPQQEYVWVWILETSWKWIHVFHLHFTSAHRTCLSTEESVCEMEREDTKAQVLQGLQEASQSECVNKPSGLHTPQNVHSREHSCTRYY